MKTKSGISLLAVSISIVVLAIITGLVITQTNNVIVEAEKSEFVVELSTIQDKIKERYLLAGSLPVQPNASYTADELKSKITDTNERQLLESEIVANKDENNSFLIVDLDAIEVETDERGKTKQGIDIFVVANNSLNVYYLQGTQIEDVVRFSLVTLVEENKIDSKLPGEQEKVELNGNLVIQKSTNTWTNELKITVQNKLSSNEELKYAIGNADEKVVGQNNIIVLNTKSMTETEKTEFETKKQILIRKYTNGNITQLKEVQIDNLDIESPVLGELEIVDATSEKQNVIKVNSTDTGGSLVKCIYYDYNTMLKGSSITPYYTDRSEVTQNDLKTFGKISNNGIIILDKNIKSIIAMAMDNAGNVSEIITYAIGE